MRDEGEEDSKICTPTHSGRLSEGQRWKKLKRAPAACDRAPVFRESGCIYVETVTNLVKMKNVTQMF